MFDIALAGFVVGFMISLPIGPMSMLAVILWSSRRYKNAFSIAAGVCLGDLTVAIVIAVLLHVYGGEFQIPLVGGGIILLGIAVVISWKAKAPLKDETLPTELAYFGKGWFATVVHPGNALTYVWLYGSVLASYGLPTMQTMTWGETSLLLTANVIGMVLGLAGFILLLMIREHFYGALTSAWRAKLSYVVSVVTVLVAVTLFFKAGGIDLVALVKGPLLGALHGFRGDLAATSKAIRENSFSASSVPSEGGSNRGRRWHRRAPMRLRRECG